MIFVSDNNVNLFDMIRTKSEDQKQKQNLEGLQVAGCELFHFTSQVTIQ